MKNQNHSKVIGDFLIQRGHDMYYLRMTQHSIGWVSQISNATWFLEFNTCKAFASMLHKEIPDVSIVSGNGGIVTSEFSTPSVRVGRKND